MSNLRDHRHELLRGLYGATVDELAYIDSLIELRRKHPRRRTNDNSEPSQILDPWLYHGDWTQANNVKLLETLSITHIVNVTERSLLDQSRQILHIPSQNSLTADLLKSFHTTNTFLETCREQDDRVLVHCQRGVSRSSTIILAYLMYHKKWTVLQAYEYLLTKRQQAIPNHVLLLQLIRFEHELGKVQDKIVL